MMKLAVFDFDSTLMDGETIDFLADLIGVKDKVSKITQRAMEGKLDFFESLTQRVAFLKDVKEALVDEVCANLPLMPGAFETVNELKKMGYRVICFSGGFKNATTVAMDKLGLDAQFSNVLHAKNGFLTGLVGGEMMFSNSKGKMLLGLQKLMDISRENTIAVGDGANDLSMFEFAGTKIAFCAKEILRKNADIIIKEKDLTLILDKIKVC